MARTRKSHEPGEEKPKTRTPIGLGAYSPMVDGHKYVIYATWAREGDPVGKVLVLKFLGTFAAKRMVTMLIGKDDWEWQLCYERDDMIVTSKGIKIRAGTTQMKEIMRYEPTEAEDAWRDEQLIASVQRFLYGSREVDRRDEPEVELEDADGEMETPRARTKAAKLPKAPKVVKEKKARVDTSDMVTANDIAKKLGVEGREVRGVLRAMKMEKPAHGWAFDKKTAADIEAKVTAGLKAAKKGKKK